MGYIILSKRCVKHASYLTPVGDLHIGEQYFYPGRVVSKTKTQLAHVQENKPEYQALKYNGDVTALSAGQIKQRYKNKTFTTDFAQDDETNAYGVLVTRVA